MADEVIIIDVELKGTDAEKKVDELTGSILSLQEANKGLKAEMKKTDEQLAKEGKSRKELAIQLERNNTKMAKEKQERKANIKVQQTEKNSIDALKAANARMRKERDALVVTDKKSRAELQKLNSAINKNDSTIRKNTDSLSKQRMNIGNYASAMQGLPGPVGVAGGAIKGLTAILKANPIVFIITAIVGAFKLMKNILKGNQQQMDKFKAASKGLGARLAVLKDRINEVVSGERELKGAFKGVRDEMNAEAKAAMGLEKRRQKLRDEQIAFIETEADLERQIEENRLAAKDQTKSDQERLSFLKAAVAAEQQLTEKRAAFARENADIITKEVELGMSTAEEIKEAAEARAEATRIETASLKTRQRITSELTGFEKRLATEKELADQEEIERKQALLALTSQIAEQEKETLAMFAEADAELFAEVDEMINKMAEETAKATAGLNKDQLNQIAEQVEAEKEAAAEKVRIAEAEAEAKYAAFSGLSASLASLFGEETKLGKAAAVIATTINTYRGAQAAFAQTPGGIIAKSAAAAAAIASGLANLKQIRSTPTMAEGGVIDGPSHAQGGITLLRADTMTPVAEVEGRESLYVVNKRDTPLIDKLNAVNSIHGKPFGSTRYAADGGEINTTIDTSGISTALIEAVSRLQIFVKVRDIVEGTGNYVNVVQSAEV